MNSMIYKALKYSTLTTVIYLLFRYVPSPKRALRQNEIIIIVSVILITFMTLEFICSEKKNKNSEVVEKFNHVPNTEPVCTDCVKSIQNDTTASVVPSVVPSITSAKPTPPLPDKIEGFNESEVAEQMIESSQKAPVHVEAVPARVEQPRKIRPANKYRRPIDSRDCVKPKTETCRDRNQYNDEDMRMKSKEYPSRYQDGYNEKYLDKDMYVERGDYRTGRRDKDIRLSGECDTYDDICINKRNGVHRGSGNFNKTKIETNDSRCTARDVGVVFDHGYKNEREAIDDADRDYYENRRRKRKSRCELYDEDVDDDYEKYDDYEPRPTSRLHKSDQVQERVLGSASLPPDSDDRKPYNEEEVYIDRPGNRYRRDRHYKTTENIRKHLELDKSRCKKGLIEDELKYSDYSHVPMAEGYDSRDYEYGYSFLPPEKWYPQPPHPPVCVSEKRCPVCPSYTTGTIADLKEFEASRRITPPDVINTEYVTDKLNSGR